MGKYYYYDPSLPAAITFAVLFSLSAGYHTFQLFRRKTWYFIPFLVGVFFEAIGYIIRIVSIEEKPHYELVPYILTTLFVLLAPALYAASIYMVLGRLILLVEGEAYSVIRRTWLTKIFVFGDVLSFVVQGLGGSVLTSAKTQDKIDLGSNLIVVGLVLQIVFFSLFVVVTAIFHYRISRKPTPRSETLTVPWRRFLMVLYVASVFILVRSIFRVVEYVGGRDGELQSKEVYFYVFDAALMFIVAILFNVHHPSRIVAPKEQHAIQLEDA